MAKASAKTDKSAPQFGEILESIDDALKQLEGDSLSLEEAVDTYERGMQLVRSAQERLETAEQKVRVIGMETEASNADPDPDDSDDL